MVTKTYPLIWRLTIILSIIHILSWNIALISWFWITLILIIIISKKFPFRIGNGISSKNVLSWKGFLAEIVVLKFKYDVSSLKNRENTGAGKLDCSLKFKIQREWDKFQNRLSWKRFLAKIVILKNLNIKFHLFKKLVKTQVHEKKTVPWNSNPSKYGTILLYCVVGYYIFLIHFWKSCQHSSWKFIGYLFSITHLGFNKKK